MRWAVLLARDEKEPRKATLQQVMGAACGIRCVETAAGALA